MHPCFLSSEKEVSREEVPFHLFYRRRFCRRRFVNPIYLSHLEYISKKSKTKSTWYSTDNVGLCRTGSLQLILSPPKTLHPDTIKHLYGPLDDQDL